MKNQRRRTARILGAALAAAAMLALLRTGLMAEQDVANEPVVTHTAVIRTSMGPIEIELYGLDAPKTVKNFVELAKKGFYNGILVHRVVPGFVIQMGDPQTRDTALMEYWGRGGQSIYGGEFEDELNPQAPSFKRGYVEGTLAMANRGPNTNTSQFFIMLKDDSTLKKPLPRIYTIFGRVTKGMDIVHKIESAPLSKAHQGVPASPISLIGIESVEVKPANH